MSSHANVMALATAGQDGDADFAVFRFTLGIPGFDDDLIPRVVGCLGAVLLVANHIAAGSYTTAAQVETCIPACYCRRIGAYSGASRDVMVAAQPWRAELSAGQSRGAGRLCGGSLHHHAQHSGTAEADAAWAGAGRQQHRRRAPPGTRPAHRQPPGTYNSCRLRHSVAGWESLLAN